MDILNGFTCRCGGCQLRHHRQCIVPGRGVWPAEVLFIGEAPGKTEDTLGEAFIGKPGKILERAFRDASAMGGVTVPTYFLTNVVACRPCDGAAAPNREPSGEEVLACWRRLQFTERKVQPKIIVFLGSVAAKHLKKVYPEAISLVHPAYVLRQGGVTSSAYRAFIRGLSVVFRRARELRASKR
jgi:uracil-DNA glycosylase family 4